MMQREKPVDKMEPGSPHHSSHSLLIIQNICLCIQCIHNLQGDFVLPCPSLTYHYELANLGKGEMKLREAFKNYLADFFR